MRFGAEIYRNIECNIIKSTVAEFCRKNVTNYRCSYEFFIFCWTRKYLTLVDFSLIFHLRLWLMLVTPKIINEHTSKNQPRKRIFGMLRNYSIQWMCQKSAFMSFDVNKSIWTTIKRLNANVLNKSAKCAISYSWVDWVRYSTNDDHSAVYVDFLLVAFFFIVIWRNGFSTYWQPSTSRTIDHRVTSWYANDTKKANEKVLDQNNLWAHVNLKNHQLQ